MRILGHIKVSCALAACAFSLSMYMGYEYTVSLTCAVFLALGSVGPDFTELGIIKHRTHTHFPWYYVLAGYGAWYAFGQAWIDELMLVGIVSYCFGCVVHILCDWPYYKGIPLFTPNKQIPLTQFEFSHRLNVVLENITIVVIAISTALIAMR